MIIILKSNALSDVNPVQIYTEMRNLNVNLSAMPVHSGTLTDCPLISGKEALFLT